MKTRLIACSIFLHLLISPTLYADEFISFYEIEHTPSAYFDEDDLEDAIERLADNQVNEIEIQEALDLTLSKIKDEKISNKEALHFYTEELFKEPLKKSFWGTRSLYKKVLASLRLAKSLKKLSDLEYRAFKDTLSLELNYPVLNRPNNNKRNDHFKKEKKHLPALFELSDYYKKKARIEKYSGVPVGDVDITSTEDDFLYKVNTNKKYTARELLYLKYSPLQIKAMSKITEYLLKIMMAHNTYVVVELMDEEDIIIQATITDQYRLALREYRRMKKKYEAERLKIGVPVSDVDVLLASLEMGVITREEVVTLFNNPSFYTPVVPLEKKILFFMKDLALLGLSISPTTAPYVILPMIIYRSFNEADESLKSAEEDDFLFTEPSR